MNQDLENKLTKLQEKLDKDFLHGAFDFTSLFLGLYVAATYTSRIGFLGGMTALGSLHRVFLHGDFNGN